MVFSQLAPAKLLCCSGGDGKDASSNNSVAGLFKQPPGCSRLLAGPLRQCARGGSRGAEVVQNSGKVRQVTSQFKPSRRIRAADLQHIQAGNSQPAQRPVCPGIVAADQVSSPQSSRATALRA